MARDPDHLRQVLAAQDPVGACGRAWLTGTPVAAGTAAILVFGGVAGCSSDPGDTGSSDASEEGTYCTTQEGWMQDREDRSDNPRLIPNTADPKAREIVDPKHCDDETDGHGHTYVFTQYHGPGSSSYPVKHTARGGYPFYVSNQAARTQAGLPATGRVTVSGGTNAGAGSRAGAVGGGVHAGGGGRGGGGIGG